ncbi:MAG: DUF5938 domain-containing protein, partial [Pseudomonadota bacterium]|nr:DUF5938 domain-containing protein [Pseudomonadota bacterium]
IPFTAVSRNAKRTQEMMAQRVVRLESATYEILEAEHNLESLVKAFKGAKVVCNTVGPFVNFGLLGVEAALKADCHYLDTTGEQSFIRNVRDQFGEQYRQAGLLVSPSTSYMYTYAEIAAELALETHGIDALETATLARTPREAAGVSVGSAASIFELLRAPACFLWEKNLVPHAVNASFNVVSPDFVQPVFSLPWSGTSLPVFYQGDSRVRSCLSSVGFYDAEPMMRTVHGLAQKWDAEYKHLPLDQQEAILKNMADSTTPSMPPRERTTINRTVDFAIGRGQLAAVRATVHGVTPYIATGALQAAAVIKLLDGDSAKFGFASACKAFGHRYMLGFLEQRGLARASVTQL